MPCKKADLNGEDEVMLRCRRVRDELSRRYPTAEKMYGWLLSLEKQPDKRRRVGSTKARANRKSPKVSAVKRRVKTVPAFKAHPQSAKKTARTA